MNKTIISIVILALIAGVFGFKYYEYQHPEKFKTENIVLGPEAKENKSVIDFNSTSPTTNPVDVQITAPINGVMKGVIEVGASGFNSFVIRVDKDKNWELVSKEFGESLAYEGFVTTSDVQSGLKKYLASMFTKGVNGKNAHFVMSSGALKNPKTKLIADAIEKMGYVVNRVDAAQEGKYALIALLPSNYKSNSFVVDIGSGNTKVSWYDNGSLKSVECAGAKYYQIPRTDEDVYSEIQKAVTQVPATQRKYVFMIGGAPFQLAKQVRNGEERFTALQSPDFYNAGEDVKLKSGLNIYKAIYDTAASESYIFDWDANFTIGFLISL